MDYNLLKNKMRMVFTLLIILSFSNLLLCQDSLNYNIKRQSDIDIIFSILDKSNEIINSENRILTLLDSLAASSEIQSSELFSPEKNKVLNASGARDRIMRYSIGDKALGGIIFWIDTNGLHGLVAAESDQSEGETWYEGKTFSLKDGIFSGKFNTEHILINKSLTYYASQVCDSYNGGGYSDWYLPSKSELNLLYKNRNLIGGFAKDYYWSSTEDANNTAWLLSFYGGFYSNYIKYGSTLFRVRAIRAF